MFSQVEDLLPVISFGSKKDSTTEKQHAEFVQRMTARGYTSRQVRRLVDWYMRVNKAGCLDRCSGGPVAVVYPEGTWYSYVDEADIDEMVEASAAGMDREGAGASSRSTRWSGCTCAVAAMPLVSICCTWTA